MRILWEAHSHTTLCNHAHGTVEEYADVALSRNLEGIHITCHTPLPHGWSSHVRMKESELDLYLSKVDEVRQKFEGRLKVGTGLECDYLPELESWIPQIKERYPWSHFLGSVHPQTKEYRERYATGNPDQNIARYFQLIAKSAESGFFDTLGHPDLIKNEYPEIWNLQSAMKEILKALDRVAATGVAMEMNTSGWNKAIQEVNPGPLILKEMAARNIPVVLGADAHRPHRVADRFEESLQILQQAGYKEVGVQSDRQRRMVSIEVALESLKKVGNH